MVRLTTTTNLSTKTNPSERDNLIHLALADEPIRKSDTGGMVLMHGIGSSDVEDLEGDIMDRSLLQKLCAPVDRYSTCYIDHKYDQEHVLGRLYDTPTLHESFTKDGRKFAAVGVQIKAFMGNPLAQQTVLAFDDGIQLGLSVGLKPLEYEPVKDLSGRPTGGVRFTDGERREFSSTTMPANDTAWVTAIVKTLKSAGILPSDDDANELRHIARHWDELDTLDGARIMRVSRALSRRAISVTAAGFLQDKQYRDLSEAERGALADSVRKSLAI